MLNHIVIMGRLVRDPELRTTQSGIPVTSFTLACERDFKDQGSGEKATDFIDVVAWRHTAEFVCKYLSKGRMAVAEGRLQIREYKDRDGNNRKAAEIQAEHVYFADSAKSDSGSGQSRAQSNYSAPAQNSYGGYNDYPGNNAFADISDDDGDLPF